MKIRHVEFKDGAVYDHAMSRELIRRLRTMAGELDLIRQGMLSPGVLGDSANLMVEAATWISIMTDAFMEEDEDA